jgi:hypothetical protein
LLNEASISRWNWLRLSQSTIGPVVKGQRRPRKKVHCLRVTCFRFFSTMGKTISELRANAAKN